MNARRESLPGSGLPIAPYLAVLTISVAIFLAYDGLLWRAPREASHVARFVVSYLAVLPLSALCLLGLHRFTWSRFITTTGSVWAIKMVVTAVLYQAFARGTAEHLTAAAPALSVAASAGARAEYRPAAMLVAGKLTGRVLRGGKPGEGAVVFLDAPRPGRALPPPTKVDLILQGARYAEPLYVARSDDEVRVLNRDALLHTVHVHGPGKAPQNHPAPPSAEPTSIETPEPGLYQLRCDMHPEETAFLLVVDHPYVARADATGAFSMEGAPAGEARVVAVTVDGARVLRAERQATIAAGQTNELTIDVDARGGS